MVNEEEKGEIKEEDSSFEEDSTRKREQVSFNEFQKEAAK